MSYQILDLQKFEGDVHSSRGRLVIEGKEVPLEGLGAIVIGSAVRIAGGTMLLAAKYDVPILTVDWRGLPEACTLPWSENSRVAARFRAQVDLTVPRQKNAWMQIIKAKILGQGRNLRSLGYEGYDQLKQYAEDVRSGDPSNLEARAARSYWSKIPVDGGFSRSPGGDFSLNPMLDYGYAVIRSWAVRGICEAGLHPTLGIFHRNRSNVFALADDFVEPFRPAVDYIVFSLEKDSSLNQKETKAKIVSVLSTPMDQEGETVGTAIKTLASRFAIYAEGDTDKLDVPTWSPPRG
jgi:CRISPR-associated protein Cas1